MYALGHWGIAALLYAPIGGLLIARKRERLAVACGTATVVLSTLPDVDQLIPGVSHRGPTHTVWFALFVGLAAGFAIVSCARGRGDGPIATRHGRWIGCFCAVSILSHLLGDVLTPMGIRPFAPLTGAHYSLDLVASGDPGANRSLFTAGVLAAAAAWNLGVVLRNESEDSPSGPELVADAVTEAFDEAITVLGGSPDAPRRSETPQRPSASDGRSTGTNDDR